MNGDPIHEQLPGSNQTTKEKPKRVTRRATQRPQKRQRFRAIRFTLSLPMRSVCKKFRESVTCEQDQPNDTALRVGAY